MDKKFGQEINSLHPKFDELTNMKPVHLIDHPNRSLPDIPTQGIYLFSSKDTG
jgi:hypothetical protein